MRFDSNRTYGEELASKNILSPSVASADVRSKAVALLL